MIDMVFCPRDPKMRSVLERLERERIAITSNEAAKQLARYKQIREMRELKQISIGNDRRNNESIIYVKKPIRRKGNGFLL